MSKCTVSNHSFQENRLWEAPPTLASPKPPFFCMRNAAKLLELMTLAGHRSLVSFLLALVFASGCATNREWRGLNEQYEHAQLSDYYHDEVSKAVPAEAVAAKDPETDEIIQELAKLQKEWVAKAGSRELTAFLPDEAALKQARSINDTNKTLDAALTDNVSMDQLIAVAYLRNPGLNAARKQLKAALERFPQAAQLDTILKQFNAFTKELNTQIGPQQQKEMMAMKFPFPDTTALKGKIVNEEVAQAQQDYEKALRDLITKVKLSYHNYLYLDSAIAVNTETKDLLKQTLNVAQAEYRVDKGKYSHVIMVQVELAKLTDAIITLEDKRTTVQATLNALLNRKPDSPLGEAAEIEPALPQSGREEITAIAVRNRQEIRKLTYMIQRMDLMVQMASRMTYPDATLGASYFEYRMKQSPGFMPKKTLNERKEVLFGYGDAYVREMRLKVDALRDRLRNLENKTQAKVKELYSGLDAAQRSLELHRKTLLPQARQAEKAAGQGYRNGNTSFITYLDAQRSLLKFQLMERQALRDRNHLLAKLDQLAGQTLPRKDQKEGKEQ